MRHAGPEQRARRIAIVAMLACVWLAAAPALAAEADVSPIVEPFTLDATAALAKTAPSLEALSAATAAQDEDKEDTDWEFSLEAAFSASGGNTRQSNVDVEANAKKEWDGGDEEFTAFARSEWGEAKPKDGGDRERDKNRHTAGAEYRHMVDNPIYVFARQHFERDEFADIKFRSDTFVGAGSRLVKNDEHEVNAQVGIGYTTTDYFSEDRDGNPSGLFAQDWTWQINEQWEFIETFELISNLKEIDDDFRTTTTADLKTDITDNMFFSFGVEHRYDSDPEGDAGREDWSILAKLGIKF